jgi:hypothetical protein
LTGARLQGSVVFDGKGVPHASLSAFDLATGKPLALQVGATSLPAGAKILTDAQGRFDLGLPSLAEGAIIKLVATTGAQTYTALFDARGRAVGASYRIQQAVTVKLKLSAASTAATAAFEGALKLTFQLPASVRDQERAATLAAAEQAAKSLEAALQDKPELAQTLVSNLGASGTLTDPIKFRDAVTKLGVFDQLFEAVKGRLVAVTVQTLSVSQEGLDPIRAADFPLDRVTISQSGTFTFTGGQATIGGGQGATFVSTTSSSSGGGGGGRRRAATPTPSPTPTPTAMKLTSLDFVASGTIPEVFTCFGNSERPSLAWSDVPASATSLAIIVTDLDAGNLMHWGLWNLDPTVDEIASDAALPALSRTGDWGWAPPCPPDGEIHRYQFRLYALTSALAIASGSIETDIATAITSAKQQNKVLAEADLIGTVAGQPDP